MGKKKMKTKQKRLEKYPLTVEALLSVLDDMANLDLSKDEADIDSTLLFFMSRQALERSMNRRVRDYVD